MADLIRIKGGRGNVPILQDREMGYSKDEEALYIGTEGGNIRLVGAKDKSVLQAKITVLEEAVASLTEDNTVLKQKTSAIESSITAIEERLTDVEGAIADIIARLEVLETPSE